jgi:hypothetical protein
VSATKTYLVTASHPVDVDDGRSAGPGETITCERGPLVDDLVDVGHLVAVQALKPDPEPDDGGDKPEPHKSTSHTARKATTR